jgi:7-carboxy-7-deazaguanine synthase
MIEQTAAVSEIFSSLQGEGTHLGERHLFLRFEACNIHCEYCDELGKPGYDFDLNSTLESLKRLNLEFGPHPFLSLTGGEPLLYTPFIKSLIPHLKELRLKIYLETNGILAKPLREVIRQVDVVAMDVKPASVTKERSFIKEHEEFLNISVQKETFIKMVCSEEIDLNEFAELCAMIGRVDAKVPLILQPISGEIEGHENPALMNLLSELQSVGLGILKDVRIVPRLHKILKMR